MIRFPCYSWILSETRPRLFKHWCRWRGSAAHVLTPCSGEYHNVCFVLLCETSMTVTRCLSALFPCPAYLFLWGSRRCVEWMWRKFQCGCGVQGVWRQTPHPEAQVCVATCAEYVSTYVCDCCRMCVSMYDCMGDSICHRRFWTLDWLDSCKEQLASKSAYCEATWHCLAANRPGFILTDV